MKVWHRLWRGDEGFVVSAELVLIATVLVIGLLVGLVTIRDQVVQELADVADAISEVDQSFSFSGVTGHASSTSGTIFNDTHDFCEDLSGSDQHSGLAPPQCISFFFASPSSEDT